MAKRKPARNTPEISRTQRAEAALQIHSCMCRTDWKRQSPAEAWKMKSKEEHLTDLLADLVHWADGSGRKRELNFERCYLMAARHYDAEREGRE